jgi:5-methylcytosine-specific restriction enzyme A
MRTLRPRLATINTRFGRQVTAGVDHSFYGTPEWRLLRREVIKAAGGRCQWDGCGRAEPRMHCDHIIEVTDGGSALDRSNLWCLCQTHHNSKTADEKAFRTG